MPASICKGKVTHASSTVLDLAQMYLTCSGIHMPARTCLAKVSRQRELLLGHHARAAACAAMWAFPLAVHLHCAGEQELLRVVEQKFLHCQPESGLAVEWTPQELPALGV